MPADADVERFLTEHHGAPPRALTRLTGGFWSAAYAYELRGDELVARFGEMKDGFEADRDAMAHASEDLPVPEVLAVGDAPFGGAYAISRRHHGRFLEDMGPEVAPALTSLLGALRAVPPADAEHPWREWLLGGLTEKPGTPTAGWRDKLRAHPTADAAFERALPVLHELVAAVPERRDLIHGDLLHKNVLVSDDGGRVNAVFSWKCSTRGDHLYDVAWCTLWGRLAHSGIHAAMQGVDIEDDVRHRCYELLIATEHLGWYAWTDDAEWLGRTAAEVSRLTVPA